MHCSSPAFSCKLLSSLNFSIGAEAALFFHSSLLKTKKIKTKLMIQFVEHTCHTSRFSLLSVCFLKNYLKSAKCVLGGGVIFLFLLLVVFLIFYSCCCCCCCCNDADAAIIMVSSQYTSCLSSATSFSFSIIPSFAALFQAPFMLFDEEKHSFIINGNLVPTSQEANGESKIRKKRRKQEIN